MTDMKRIVQGVLDKAITVAADGAKRVTASVTDAVANGGFGRQAAAPVVGGPVRTVVGGTNGGPLPGPAAAPPGDFQAQAFAAAADALQGIGTEVGTLLRKNPLPTLLIAVGAGLLLASAARDSQS